MNDERSRQMQEYSGPALLSYGFRPFFLLSALWAVCAMMLWIAMLGGATPLPLRFDPVTWHAHEFLFGYLSAVIGGFVLTAVPNWTGRLPVMGRSLAQLVGLWLSGRVAISLSALASWEVIAAADLSFIITLLTFLSREVVRGRNWHNLPILVMLGFYGLGNCLFHIEAAGQGMAFDGAGMRLGLAAGLMLIALVGGRIIPSFTRNWLAIRKASALPVPFSQLDSVMLMIMGLTLLLFVLEPELSVLRWMMLFTGILHLWRLSRWCGWQVRIEPLLWVLHLAYAMLALGFLAEAITQFWGAAPVTVRHVWFTGAIGLMTLAVMSRATLGHTGHILHAGPGTTTVYLALLGSVFLRLVAGLSSSATVALYGSAGLWTAAFIGFITIYGPILIRPRIARKKPSRF